MYVLLLLKRVFSTSEHKRLKQNEKNKSARVKCFKKIIHLVNRPENFLMKTTYDLNLTHNAKGTLTSYLHYRVIYIIKSI